MKRITLALFSVLAIAAAGCSNEGSDELGGSDPAKDPNNRETARNPENTGTGPDHMNDPSADPNNSNGDNTPQKVENDNKVGGADVASRLHACGKITYTALGAYLRAHGVTGGAAMTAYTQGAQSLGIPNYGARAAEAPFPSAAAFAKQFDILTLASTDIIANLKTSTACPGVDILSADAKSFNKDGISCIIGVPATDAHVAVANQAIAENPTDGAKIAIAALLLTATSCN